jgi:pimeloyl-ACP methyl ester carboxylesterase
MQSRNASPLGSVTDPGRSPVPAILFSIVAGAALAVVLMLWTGPDGSEPLVTGSVLIAFGLGWALMAFLTSRFSGQPQRWLYVPAATLAGVGLLLVLLQPAPAVMDALGWVWPIGLAVLGVWMFVRLGRQLRGAGRFLVGALIAALLLVAVAGGLTTVGGASTAGGVVAPGVSFAQGQLVDIGGRRLYLQCEGTGGPVVILQAGLGSGAASWARIKPAIAGTTTVCSYDRAGRGRSDPAPALQDGNALASDLHDLLTRAGIPGPYVMVAHSSGASYVRVYTAAHPAEVVGLVLLDPQPADAFGVLPDYPATYDSLRLTSGLAPSLARVGLLAVLFGVSQDQATAAIARSQRDEIRALPTVLEQAHAAGSLGNRPVIVVSAGTGGQRGWAEAQAAMASLSTNGLHRVIDRATHASLIEGDDAPASTEAILDVLAATRS